MAYIFITFRVIGVLLVIFGSKSTRAASTAGVSSTEDTNKNAIEGFGTSFQCSVNTCLSPNQKVKWFKNNILIADGTATYKDRAFIRYSVDLNQNACSGKCSHQNEQSACPETQFCRLVDNTCCNCNKEEFTLVLTNVSSNDSGKYKCQLDNGNSVEIRLTVMEGGIPTLGENLTFNHSACCEERGMSAECMPMCRPSLLETHKFDPVPCQKEFSKLLHCSTEGGNISHSHCCRLHLVPAFCWEYCSNTPVDFSRAKQMCVYWMPEIFQCYEQAYLPLPGPPEGLVVNAFNSTALEACWDTPERNSKTIRFYSVRYQEVPRFPLLGGGVPLLTGDSDFPSEGDVFSAPNDDEAPDFAPVVLNPSRNTNKGGRKKRQTLIITSHNFATNETEVREYRYLEVNTTDNCVMLPSLKPATQYFVYVTATNDYGMSLPSQRQTALTEAVIYTNESMPNIQQCCIDKKVESSCLPKICDIEHPPSSVNAFDLAFTCKNEFPTVAPCLADGRDHTECCREKGVIGECLKFCDGSITQMGMSSVLCLSLDIQAIFSCFREGYIKLPSPPVNVTVKSTDSTSVEITWSPPLVNDDKVANYSLFYRRFALEQYIEVTDVKSPFILVNLLADTTYNLYLVARSSIGSSLKSTDVSFTTAEPEFENVCQHGRPLLDAYGKPLRCSVRLQCPISHNCVDSETDDPDLKYCCPVDGILVGPTVRVVPPNVTACCEEKGVHADCLGLCNYKTTKDDLTRGDIKCARYVDAFIECGGDQRNDYPCCVKANVSSVCLDFCHPPLRHELTDYIPCLIHADSIIHCALEGVLTLPGPPVNVTVEDKGPTWVTLHWKRPRQSPTVDRYEIIIDDISKGNTTGLSTTVSSLEPDRFYVAHVVAWNSRGSSLPTDSLNISLKSDTSAGSKDDSKPRPPNTIQRVWFKDHTANVTWKWNNLSVTDKPITRFQFQVLYRSHSVPEGLSTEQWRNVSTTLTSALLNDITANKTYDIKIKAINTADGVEGLFSETAIILMSDAEQSVTLDLHIDPTGILKNGTRATVTCKANGYPTPQVTLTKGGRQLSKGSGTAVFIFGIVRPKDGSEPIVCEADNGGGVVRKTENMKVQYLPIVVAQLPRSTNEDLPASLICSVQSYPDPKVSWFFLTPVDQKPKEIVQDSNYETHFLNSDRENFFNASLTIERTRKSDSGSYICRACNEFGCGNATIQLTVEPLPLPKGPEYIFECCEKANVKSQCMSVCTSEININAISNKNIDCLVEFPKFLACSKDGIDNRRCCADSRVSETCLVYCDGARSTTGDVFSKMNECSSYQNQIMQCLEDGHKELPLPPESLTVAQLADDRVNVSWKPPVTAADQILLYVLYYKSANEKSYHQVLTDKPFHVVSGLKSNVLYNFTAISKNHYGWSSFAPQLSSLIDSSHSSTNSTKSSSSAGVIFGVIFCLLLAAIFILAFVYYSRRPYKLPTFLLKWGNRAKHNAAESGAVAFENPGYDKEGQVRGLPGDRVSNGPSSSNGTDPGWEHAHLETPNESPTTEQRGLHYTPLT